jgi:hypothetical protein
MTWSQSQCRRRLRVVGILVGCRLAAAETVARANYGLGLGKFELDFDDGEVRFQVSQILVDDAVGQAVIDRMIGAAVTRHLPANRLAAVNVPGRRMASSISKTVGPASCRRRSSDRRTPIQTRTPPFLLPPLYCWRWIGMVDGGFSLVVVPASCAMQKVDGYLRIAEALDCSVSRSTPCEIGKKPGRSLSTDIQ